MTDVRARITEALTKALRGKPATLFFCAPDHADHLTDVLLALDGIAVVALPTQTIIPTGWGEDCIGAWPVGDEGRPKTPLGPMGEPVSAWPEPGHEVALPDGDLISARKARALAAALLAAADAAERAAK